MQATITKSTGSWYDAKDTTGKLWRARIKGKFRLQGIKSTNPIAVGDVVEIEPEGNEEDLALIDKLYPRKNYIIRKSNNLSKQTQIIAANIDVAALVVTLAFPRTSQGFIDRFLVTAEAYHIPAILVFNKTDIYGDDGEELLSYYEKMYEPLGYQCFRVSALEGENLDVLRSYLKGKTTLVSGHSGVGKSTLLNALWEKIGQKTGIISDFSSKGKHTTTFAEMFEPEEGTRIIDTPGIKNLGLVDMEQEMVSHYFPEMRPLLQKCRFNNCKHINEPHCAVKNAVENESISAQRYFSYLSILNNEDIYN